MTPANSISQMLAPIISSNKRDVICLASPRLSPNSQPQTKRCMQCYVNPQRRHHYRVLPLGCRAPVASPVWPLHHPNTPPQLPHPQNLNLNLDVPDHPVRAHHARPRRITPACRVARRKLNATASSPVLGVSLAVMSASMILRFYLVRG